MENAVPVKEKGVEQCEKALPVLEEAVREQAHWRYALENVYSTRSSVASPHASARMNDEPPFAAAASPATGFPGLPRK